MNSLLAIFSQNILPIFLAAGAGYLLGRTLDIDPRMISRVVFYIFSPCLVFKLLTENQLSGDATVQMVGYAITVTILTGLITWLAGRLANLDRNMMAAVLLSTMFTNAGNFGLSLNSFAFGENALAYASLYFVMSAIMVNTFGVIIASMGKTNLKDSFVGLLKLPTVFALFIAFIFNWANWSLPLPVDRAVGLLANAAIPAMLVILGLQLKRVSWKNQLAALSLANGIRLAVGPVLAIGLSYLFDLQGAALQAGVSEASMPTAVITIILATEFDTNPAFVTSVVTSTTLLSPLTLTPLLAFLGG